MHYWLSVKRGWSFEGLNIERTVVTDALHENNVHFFGSNIDKSMTNQKKFQSSSDETVIQLRLSKFCVKTVLSRSVQHRTRAISCCCSRLVLQKRHINVPKSCIITLVSMAITSWFKKDTINSICTSDSNDMKFYNWIDMSPRYEHEKPGACMCLSRG